LCSTRKESGLLIVETATLMGFLSMFRLPSRKERGLSLGAVNQNSTS